MTYAEIAARKDRDRRRAIQDQVDEARHRKFDLQAQDKTPKSARHHFAVVGEGTLEAQAAYRRGWDRTFGGAR